MSGCIRYCVSSMIDGRLSGQPMQARASQRLTVFVDESLEQADSQAPACASGLMITGGSCL